MIQLCFLRFGFGFIVVLSDVSRIVIVIVIVMCSFVGSGFHGWRDKYFVYDVTQDLLSSFFFYFKLFRCYSFVSITRHVIFLSYTLHWTKYFNRFSNEKKNYHTLMWVEYPNVGQVEIILKFDLPTTSISPWSVTVWKEGASPDTSHLYLPLLCRLRCESTTWVSLELWICKRKNTSKWIEIIFFF